MKDLRLIPLIWLFFSQVLVAQGDFTPIVDPNFRIPQPLPGPSAFQGFQNQDVAPVQDPNVPNAPNVPDGIGNDPSAPSIDSQPTLQIPGNFPEAINEPMNAWMDWSEWDSSVELGINGSSGNSESFNVSSGFDVKRVNELTETKIGLKYINNKSDDVLVAHNARLSIDWEKKFGTNIGDRFEPSRWSWFIKNTYYYDDFRPFDLRIALNTGAGYKFFENEVQMLKGRFGAGASREFGGIADEWIPEALFGLDYRRQLSKRQKLDSTIDYFPSWENFSDYRVVADFNWEFLLDEETNLSLKLNVNNRYDSTPDGASPNDIFYSLLLLWKF